MIGSLAALQDLAAKRCLPLLAHLELTRRCNARCVHCFQDRDSAPRELDFAEWSRVVDRAREAGSLVVTLSGGEAMLSPHFWAVAEHARARGMAIRVFTNGLRLSPENVARLAALRPMAVEVSIFSVRPDRHDAVTRVPGSLARAVRGMVRLRRAGVPLTLKCPLLSSSGADHAAVRRLAERLGASVLFDPQIFPRTDGGDGPTRCRGEDALIEGYFAAEATREYDRAAPPTAPDRAPCAMGRTFVVVSPEGDVLACPVLPLSAGNVRDAPLDSIWREAPLFHRLRHRRFGDLGACGICPRSGYCQRCSALALLEDGDLDGPSSRACRMADLREQAWGLPSRAAAPPVRPPRLRVLPG